MPGAEKQSNGWRKIRMCKKLFLNTYFAELWKGKDPFMEAFRITGEDFRKVKARRTSRFTSGGKGYFIKLHSGIGYREYLKDLLQGKKPVTGAGQEFAALRLLHTIGVPTMQECAFGAKGANPAYERSFLITEELEDMCSLEELWQGKGGMELTDPLKYVLAEKLGESAGKMHRAGLNHRDCYICHFLLDRKKYREKGEVHLHVIDLHRAQIRKKVPKHYLVKDLAGLLFSALDVKGMKKTLLFRFLKGYFGKGKVREILTSEEYAAIFPEKCMKAACKLYKKDFGKAPPVDLS